MTTRQGKTKNDAMQKAFKDSAKWLKKAIMDETFKQYLNQD